MLRVMGVAGGTGAGKSTLARALAARLGDTCVLELDAYYRDRAHVTQQERRHINYDEPDAFDLELLLAHLQQLRAGHAVDKPRYSFETHTRVGTERVEGAPTVVIEGLFALWWPELRALLDLRVYVEAPPDVRFARRLERDVRERGRTPESVLAQYLRVVRPMHCRYVVPTRAHADLVVSGDSPVDRCVDRLARALEDLVPSSRPGEPEPTTPRMPCAR